MFVENKTGGGTTKVWIRTGWLMWLALPLSAFAAWYGITSCERSSLPLLATPGWMAPGDLRVRSTSGDPPGLILSFYANSRAGRRVPKWARGKGPFPNFNYFVYRYDLVNRKLIPASREEWNNAPGSTCEYRDTKRFVYGISIDPRQLKLRRWVRSHDGRDAHYEDIKTAGRYVVKARENKDGTMLAVLSASGARFPHIGFPFSGPRAVSGQHYHELFALPSMEPIGKPVAIPLRTWRRTVRMYWSCDNRYVIYAYAYIDKMCIVHLDHGDD